MLIINSFIFNFSRRKITNYFLIRYNYFEKHFQTFFRFHASHSKFTVNPQKYICAVGSVMKQFSIPPISP